MMHRQARRLLELSGRSLRLRKTHIHHHHQERPHTSRSSRAEADQSGTLTPTVFRRAETIEVASSSKKPSANATSLESSSSSPASAAKPCAKKAVVDVEEIARSVGVRLTKNEIVLLRKTLGSSCGSPTKQMQELGQRALQEKTTREICLNAIANPENPVDKWGVRVISFFDYAGTALFAIVGTQVAGDTGMNIVGCGLVGCVAALGGGSLNAVLYGGASSVLGRPGVRWVTNPSYLLVALVSSALTFFIWPYYCETQAEHYVENVIGKENVDPITGNIGKEAFLAAWKRDAAFRRTISEALPHVETSSHLLAKWRSANNHVVDDDVHLIIEREQLKEGLIYFQQIDDNDSGDLDMEELQRLVQRRFYNGWETYFLDTLGLSSLSIAAVIMAIRVGLNPIVAATSGVTVCFGGIFRDLLCGRDLAVGSQSYALCTGASSTMYVFLRELSLRKVIALPLVMRTFLSAGTCVALRSWEWYCGKPLLAPMHGRREEEENTEKNRARGSYQEG